MLAFLTGLLKRLRKRPAHRPFVHDRGAKRVRVIPLESSQFRVATVDQNQTRHALLTGVSTGGGRPAEQLESLLREATSILARGNVQCPVPIWLNVFLADVGQVQVFRQAVRRVFGDEQPVTTFIPQTPCEGGGVAVEVLAVDPTAEVVRRSEQMVLERHDGVEWIHCGQIVPERAPQGVYNRSYSGFLQIRNLLAQENVPMGDLIRTWLYLGDIVGPEEETQRYKELNRARTDFFEGIEFAAGRTPSAFRGVVYPASTGIGGDDADVLMACIALRTERDDVRIAPLENPDQTSAFDYAANYSPKSPKFARAMAVFVGHFGTIFVSGTASITGSESRHIEDVEAQTHQTIDNIAALIAGENLSRHGLPGYSAGLSDMAIVRAYIKRAQDYPRVRAICEARFGAVPTIYTVTDVCRPELLVEIECVAFPRQLMERRTLIAE